MKKSDKILIVEDDRDTCFILEKLLSKNKFEVKSVYNGKEALEIIDSFSPKVILADWTMPVMDGLELCDIVKKNEKYKIIYFIILTARTSLRDRVTGLDIGADDFLVKPFENQELIARLRSGIRIFDLQNELKTVEHSKAVIEIACTIGHKINNPLNSLTLALENLKDEMKDKIDNNLQEEFLTINKSLQRINDLIKQLTHLENPEVINYTDDSKMIKLD